MTQRGRKSGKHHLTIIGPHGIEQLPRPKPPPSLSAEAADEWRKIVDAMAAEYFRPETHALLELRCQHFAWSRDLRQAIQAELQKPAEEFQEQRYQRLMQLAAMQTRAIAIIDSKLRLTHESVYDRSEPKPTAKARPWSAA